MDVRQTDRGLEVNLVLRLPRGLHARPSARLSKLARSFKSSVIFINQRGEADAKSMVDLLSLAPQLNDEVTLIANGPDAAAALTALYGQLTSPRE